MKPFDGEELLARVEALLRRARPDRWAGDEGAEGLRLVPERRAVLWSGYEVRLSATEYRLIQALVRNAGRVVTTEQLLDQVWDDPTTVGRDRVKFGVLRLRRKLREAARPEAVDPIETVWGVGYRFVCDEGVGGQEEAARPPGRKSRD